MTLLIVLMGAAVLLVLALLLRPFWWSTSDAEVSRRSLNTAILREQLAKLEVDRADNLLREEDFAQARDELQKRVLQDAAQDTPVATQGSPKWTVIALVLLMPIAAFGLYALLGSPAAIEGDGGAPHSAQQQEIDNMVAGLAKKLEKDPGNLQGWAVLARSYKVMGRMADAEQAFARAGNFIDNDAQMLVSYADVLVANANGNFAGKPMQLIDKALKVDPNNVMALWLAGTAAFRTEDYTKAVRTWERLLVLLEPGTEDANTLQNALDEAYAKLGKSPAPLVRPAPSAALREAPVAAASASNASVSGEVVLDAGCDWEKARAQLLALPGIGPWTAEIVAMRGLGDPDAFPATDLGVRVAAEQAGLPGDAVVLAAYSTRWRPWRSYAVQHLWTTLDHSVNHWPPKETM